MGLESSPGLARRMIGHLAGAPPTPQRFERLREIEKLDPVEDCLRVYRLFLEDFQAAGAFRITAGLFVTYAAPSISRILAESQAFERGLLKRLVDTMILDDVYHEQGFEPGPGREAIRRVNEMHRKYDIVPEDFVYIGCHEALSNIWFAETYGWRTVTDGERIAAQEFAKLRGKHMYGSAPYPETLDEMQVFCDEWEDKNLYFEPQNEKLAKQLIDFVLADLPRPLRPAARAFFLSVGPDDRYVTACGIDMPSKRAQGWARWVMRQYGRLDPLVDGPSKAALKLVERLYPDGYEIRNLGTHVK